MSQVFLSEQQLRGSMVAINQTRSQVEEVSENKKCHLQTTSYKAHTFKREFYQVTNIWTAE